MKPVIAVAVYRFQYTLTEFRLTRLHNKARKGTFPLSFELRKELDQDRNEYNYCVCGSSYLTIGPFSEKPYRLVSANPPENLSEQALAAATMVPLLPVNADDPFTCGCVPNQCATT